MKRSARQPPVDLEARFAALPDSLCTLARQGVPRSYRAGRILIEEGDRGDSIYIVLAGRLRAYSHDLRRDREVTYGTYGPGDYVGEFGLDGGPRTANVLVESPSVCVLVTRPTLLRHMQEHPEFALELLAKVIGRARVSTLNLRQMALNDVQGRIKLLLESIAGRRDAEGWAACDRMGHKAMSSLVGCSREMVSRVLKGLEVRGHLRIEDRRWLLRLPLPSPW